MGIGDDMPVSINDDPGSQRFTGPLHGPGVKKITEKIICKGIKAHEGIELNDLLCRDIDHGGRDLLNCGHNRGHAKTVSAGQHWQQGTNNQQETGTRAWHSHIRALSMRAPLQLSLH